MNSRALLKDLLGTHHPHLETYLFEQFKAVNSHYLTLGFLLVLLLSERTFSGYYCRYAKTLAVRQYWTTLVQTRREGLLPEIFQNPRLSVEEKEKLYLIVKAELNTVAKLQVKCKTAEEFWNYYEKEKPTLKQCGLIIHSPRESYSFVDQQYFQLPLELVLEACLTGINPQTKQSLSPAVREEMKRDLDLELRCFEQTLATVKN